VAWERGDNEEAAQHLGRAGDLGEAAGLPQQPYRWRVAMVHLRESEGDAAVAAILLSEAERLFNSDFSPNARPVPAVLARLHVRIGDLAAARGWAAAAGVAADDELRYLREYEHLTLARLLLAEHQATGDQDRLDRAVRLLGRLHDDPRSTKRINASPGHAVLETKSGLYTSLIMRQDAAPTNHPDFVQAMKHLFDRELIRRALFRGFAVIGNDHPIPPGHRYYRADLPQRSYDPERARFHLRRAGLSNIRLPIYASPAAEGSVDMGSVLQETAAGIGLKLAVNRVPADGYWSNHWMKHPLGFGNTNPRPTADLLFSLFYQSDAPWNESGWKNPQFDQLLVAARSEADEGKRKQMYGDMQELVHEKCGVGIPVFISLIDGYDRRIRGFGSIPIGGLMGYSFADHVWLEG
jgi:hypothetical protein